MDSKSRSELFNTHKGEAASGLPVDPQVLSEKCKDNQPYPRERIVSNSGPLAPGMSWTSSGRKNDAASTRNGSSTLLGSKGLPSAEFRDNVVSAHVEATNQVGRHSQSFGEPVRKQDRRRQSQMLSAAQLPDYGRINTKETALVRKHSTWITHIFSCFVILENKNLSVNMRTCLRTQLTRASFIFVSCFVPFFALPGWTRSQREKDSLFWPSTRPFKQHRAGAERA